jgi:hypothetical protein
MINVKKKYSTTTAVLLFAQSENRESSSKPIASSLKQNVLLWKKMNGLVLNTIQNTRFPYFISNEKNQVGSSFGAKLTHSIQEIFAKGFKKVIVVGNDCLELNTQHLLEAKRDLEMNSLVIGSDFSGGAYIIGVTKSKFNAAAFEHIPWQTKKVFTALQLLYQTHSIAYLPSLHDCNSATDFKKVLDQLPYFSPLKKILASFLFVPKQQIKFEVHFSSFHYSFLFLNKGSPF